MALQQKFIFLKRLLSGYKSCLVAFSGGQDSALLLKVCSLVLPKDKILAVTAVSETYPKGELAFARRLVGEIGVKLQVVRTKELHNRKFNVNSFQRCYYCKKELFGKLITLAKENKLQFVLDGSNLSDATDYRPGAAAKKEFKIKSPLFEAGFTKKDIRNLSLKFRLSSKDKPSLACLASRVPYGTRITAGLLAKIDRTEGYLRSLGFRQVRLRHHHEICRIEVDKQEMPRFLDLRQRITRRLKKIGYNYITLDLEGYRTGSLNEVMKK